MDGESRSIETLEPARSFVPVSGRRPIVGIACVTPLLALVCGSRLASAQRVEHLVGGDSVLVWGTARVSARGRGSGILVDFQPTHSLADTAGGRREAAALFLTLSIPPSDSIAFVVFRSVTKELHRQGLSSGGPSWVVEKRGDGKWYFLGDTVTALTPGGKRHG